MVEKRKPAQGGSALGRKKTLVLLDLHAIIHRAYHALPDFKGSSGEPTGALYGLSLILLKLIKDLNPDYLVACYDLPSPTFRHMVYKEYKAKRPKMDSELSVQIARSRDILKSFNIPTYDSEGFEADDVIGTIVSESKKEKDLNIIIASGDMDTLQLVDGKKVRVYMPRKGIQDTVLYDEEAVKERYGFKPGLLVDYKGLRGDPSDNIIGIAGIGEKTATLLIQKFGTIEDIYKVLQKNPGAFTRAGFKERVVKLLETGKEEALFSKVLAQIRFDAPIEFNLGDRTWRESFDPREVKRIFSELGFRSLIERLKIMFKENDVVNEVVTEDVSYEEIREIGIALWILNSNITNPVLQDILDYSKKDTFNEAKKYILDKLEKEKKLEKIYREIELPLVPVLEKMEKRGVLIDKIYFENLSNKYHKELRALEKKIYKEAGEEFNVNSPKQLGEILYDKLKITGRVRKTEKGARSTRESELVKIKDKHPIIRQIIAYREFQKLLSTYIDNLPVMVGKDGRLHARFLQTGTTTGRFSSQNPNLQNIPIHSELGKRIRGGFIAEKGHKLVSFDYSQIELRVAALMSRDKKLLKIFKEGSDVHAATASLVFGVSFDGVTPEMRRTAKTINFGILYGMGVNALKQNLGTTREEAQMFYDSYFSIFSDLAGYLEKIKEETRKKGYTETYFGRRRYFPGINSPLPQVASAEERMAINAPHQGTNADIVKTAMIEADNVLKKENLNARAHLILQIHDELIYEIEDSVLDKATVLIKKEMESVMKTDVEFIVNVSSGASWADLG